MNCCTKTSSCWRLMTLAIALSLLGGCASLSKPYPDKSLHALSVGQPDAVATPTPRPVVLRVESVRVAPPYNATTFVYKVGESKFDNDYYNGFITAPERMLTSSLRDWLARSGLFSAVVQADTSADHQMILETNVTALYGDYTASASPVAVVEARFFLINDAGGRYEILFQKGYRQTQVMPDRSPAELVKAFDRAYGRVLGSLVEDLNNAVPIASTTAAAP